MTCGLQISYLESIKIKTDERKFLMNLTLTKQFNQFFFYLNILNKAILLIGIAQNCAIARCFKTQSNYNDFNNDHFKLWKENKYFNTYKCQKKL